MFVGYLISQLDHAALVRFLLAVLHRKFILINRVGCLFVFAVSLLHDLRLGLTQ